MQIGYIPSFFNQTTTIWATYRLIFLHIFVSAFSPQSGSLNIYKIPLMCLVGPIAADKGVAPPASPQPRPQTLLSPLVNTGNTDPNTRLRSPSCGRRSPLLRTKKLGPMSYIPSEVGIQCIA